MIRCVFERRAVPLALQDKDVSVYCLEHPSGRACARRNLLDLPRSQPTPDFQGTSHSPLKVPAPDPLVTGQRCLR